MLYTEDGSGNGTSLNLSGISGNVIGTARMDEGTEDYFYYHKDMAGSTTNLRNASGETIVSYQYSEFGETSIYGDTDFYNEICYNGGIYDESTGLYYLNARYYNPEDGRFISRDSYRGSVTNPSTLHLYAYCVNNPVNYSDPSGHFAISKIVGGIVGGLLGAAAGAKIAKSAGLTGWKKVAAIAGGAAIGAAVGVLAGPAVTKAVKAVAKTASKILPSKSQIVNTAKNLVSKGKSLVEKTVSKTKQILSKGKSVVNEPEVKNATFNQRVYNDTPTISKQITDPAKLLETTKYPQDHHIIPAFRGKSKPYADFIKNLGIDVDQYTVTVSGGKGGMHMNFIHGKGRWNQKWMNFIDDNPSATAKEIFQFAGKMMDDYGLSGLRIHPYGK